MRLRIFPFVSLLVMAPALAYAATLNVPADYSTIGAAVKAASPGDTISVATGTYAESVRIKRLDGLTLIANGAASIEPGAGSTGIVVRLSDNVTIQGFDITDAGYAIVIAGCNNTTVTENAIDATRAGIWVKRGDGNAVTNNDISDLTGTVDRFGFVYGGHAIQVRNTTNAVVFANSISSTLDEPVGDGIIGSRADGSVFRDNDVDSLGRNGILVKRTLTGRIINNDCSDNLGSGIRVNKTTDTLIDKNTTSGNAGLGIFVRKSENPTITSNSSDSNERFGIRVKRSDPFVAVSDLTAAGNTAVGNTVANYRVNKERQ